MNQQDKRAYWTTILEQQQRSGSSIKQYCIDNSISYQTFYYWAKKLNQPEPQTEVQPIVVTEPATDSSMCVILTFGNGIRAELPATLSPQQISQWVEALQ
ncbi:helix-turn-helix domain-containing protein [Vibrio sp. B1Z05]|uniref:IS66 family insertion sequence element accessory protein TnpA n=1 Tax=Vibrio sp. B1Z05 TaxID=2654980 RepID=UPI00128B4054|nr:helix-turn-helix domain-containing protein [Vibrio sp. B1Z05]MPW35306.1 helix-turn-helix domain-containing protein [Vibrio sp. B1Z05]